MRPDKPGLMMPNLLSRWLLRELVCTWPGALDIRSTRTRDRGPDIPCLFKKQPATIDLDGVIGYVSS